MLSVKEKLSAAKLWLQERQPFFGYMALSHRFIEDAKKTPTMGVDGWGNIYYNPEFVKKTKVMELAGCIAHELLHHIFQHVGRGKKRRFNPVIWNIAIDIVVNDILEHSYQGLKIPEGGFRTDNERKFSMMVHDGIKPVKIVIKEVNKKSAEKVYEELYEQLPKIRKGKVSTSKGEGEGCLPIPSGISGIPEGQDTHIHEGETDPQKIKQEVREAMEHAKRRGSMPNELERLIKGWIESKVNWREILWKFVQSNIPVDFTYARPSKKFYSTKIYFPHVVKENIEAIVCLDTSGSIDANDFREFKSEILAIARSFKSVKFKLVLCDCDIKKIEPIEISNGNYEKIAKIKQIGFGGTSHIPVIEYVKRKEPFARCMICFTDGYTEIHEEPPIPTIWVLCSNGMEESEFKERFNIKRGIVVKIRR